MESRIVIGDPHGCLKTLKALIEKLPKNIPISISGDLIDRGPDSAGVVQYCIDNKIDVTLGNHEQMMDDFFKENPKLLENTPVELKLENLFLSNGGYKTLMSYGYKVNQHCFNYVLLTPPEDLTQIKSHLEWIKFLPVHIEYPNCINDQGRKLVISHSSINSVYHNRNIFDKDERSKNLVIWGRPKQIRDIPEIYSVFGHTPQAKGARIRVPFANIDTGCCFSDKESKNEGYGILTSLQYPEMIIVTQENCED